MRILFVASLHHPEQLLRDQHAAQQNGGTLPLFPTSSAHHFWEKALLERGYVLDVFWRNLSSFGDGSIASLKSQTYTERITPQRVAEAAMRRLPYRFNLELRRRNQRLLEHALRFQPDVLWLVGDNIVIHASTLEQIRTQTGCKLLYSTGTSPIVFSHAIEREAAPLIDLVIVNDYYHGIQWVELGAREMLCLPAVAVDPDFHQPRTLTADERQQYACDVTFTGTLLPRNLYSERIAALEALMPDFQVGIWSVHDVPESLRPALRGAALGDSMLRVLSAATISLNPHGNFMRYGGNMRLFEAAAVGSFQIVDDRPGIHEWFREDEHLVIYRSMDDLREKVRYYLAHPEARQRIAAAARQHVLEHHTYEQRLDRLEDVGFFRAPDSAR
jgi:spore maturation protein CgeB